MFESGRRLPVSARERRNHRSFSLAETWFAPDVHESAADIEALQELLDRSYAAAGVYLLRIHTPERRKTWLACEEHREHLSQFLGVRGFLKDVVLLKEWESPHGA